MGVRHRELPVEGVQFHPESILTGCGHDLLRNFLAPHLLSARARRPPYACTERRARQPLVRSSAVSSVVVAAAASWWSSSWWSSCSSSWWSRRTRAWPTTTTTTVPLSTIWLVGMLCSSTVPSRGSPGGSSRYVTSIPNPRSSSRLRGLALGETDERRHPLLAGTGAHDQGDRAALVDQRVRRRVGADHDAGRDHGVDLLLDLDLEPVLGRLEQRSGRRRPRR